jgi:hypothetical protein
MSQSLASAVVALFSSLVAGMLAGLGDGFAFCVHRARPDVDSTSRTLDAAKMPSDEIAECRELSIFQFLLLLYRVRSELVYRLCLILKL